MNLRQREPRIECPAFLAFVRRRPCCACGAPPRSQAAHIRVGNPEVGKRSTGIGEKPSDRWAVPLCADCHLDAPDSQHQMGGERAFWAKVRVDPFALATKLYAQFERRQKRSPEQKKAVASRARRILRKRKPMMEPGIECDLIVTDAAPRDFRKPSRAKDPELYRYRWGASVKRPKVRGQNRKLQSTNRWPPKGTRKIQNRGIR